MLSNVERTAANADKRVAVIFFAILLVAMWAISSLTYVSHRGWGIVSQHVISGDEPHYLIVINSVLFDHDLELQDDYLRLAQGGFEGGARFRGDSELDHHTIVIDRRTGQRTPWVGPAWLAMAVRRNGFAIFGRYMVPAAEVYEVSFHPVAFPVLIAAMIAPLRPTKSEVEAYAANAVTLLGWLGALVTYFVALQAGLSRRWSLAASGSLALASPWLAYSRSLFSEVPIGLALILGLGGLAHDWPAVAGFWVAAATAMKPSFAVVAVGFSIELLMARRWRSLSRFAVVTGILSAITVTFNYWLTGEPLLPPPAVATPALTHMEGLRFDPGFGTLLAQLRLIILRFFENLISANYGLFCFAPWAAFSFWSIANQRTAANERGNLLKYMRFPCLLNFVLLASLAVLDPNGYTPGFCYGPRYWVPFLPWLAIAFVSEVANTTGIRRWSLWALAAVGAAISISGALRYAYMFAEPFYESLLIH